jgi:hypothetical protein
VARAPIPLPRRVGHGGRTTEYPPNDWSPEEVERRIAGEPVEWLYVFDPHGRQIARFRGTADEVDLSDELKGRVGGLYGQPVLRNHLLIHNHPPTLVASSGVASFPPSPTDLLTILELDIQQLIVISGGIRFTLGRPGGVWPTDEHEMNRLLERTAEKLRQQLGPEGVRW